MKFSIKQLSEADLGTVRSFFIADPERKETNKQKAIILYSKVFKSLQFPGANEKLIYHPTFRIFGPKPGDPVTTSRHLRKQHKNWRLDGGFLPTEGDESRFDTLRVNDYALIGISAIHELDASSPETKGQAIPGDEGIIVFISKTNSPVLHKVLDNEFDKHQFLSNGSRSKKPITHIPAPQHIVERILAKTLICPEGEINEDFTEETIIEEAIQSGLSSEDFASYIHYTGKPITTEEILEENKKFSETGRQGEELVNKHLKELEDKGIIKDLKWIANTHGYSSFDFSFTDKENVSTRVDVKATSGEFSRRIFISHNELRSMAEPGINYYIYRVYDTWDKPKLKISSPLYQFASKQFEWIGGLEEGIKIDKISVTPSIIFPPDAKEIEI